MESKTDVLSLGQLSKGSVLIDDEKLATLDIQLVTTVSEHKSSNGTKVLNTFGLDRNVSL